MANQDAAKEPGVPSPSVPVSPPVPAPAPPPEANPTLGEWLKRNGPALVIGAALLIFLYVKLDVEGLWNIAKAALGLGLVIFVHELGHFAVAKWCDVHVETFSIGFGPALPGCKWQRGETTYMLALFPLGGYVKMVGEGSESEEGDDDPRSFKNKSVWQRMAIISAGVIMNVILAFICFIVVFRGPGKDQMSGVIGVVEAGSPTFKMGIPSGAQLHELGDVENPYFSDVHSVVMASGADEELNLVYSVPPSPTRYRIKIKPRRDATDTRPMIGVGPADSTFMPAARYYKGRSHPVFRNTPAARADPPFEFEDEVIGCTNPAQRKPGSWKDDWTLLPEDQRNREKFQPDFFELRRRLQILAGEKVTIRVKRKEGDDLSILLPPAFHSTFGVRMQMGQVAAVRDGSPAEKAGVQPPVTGEKRRGDIIALVKVLEPDGKSKAFLFPQPDWKKGSDLEKLKGDLIDPLRLHFELRAWARRCDVAEKKSGKKIPRKVTLLMSRENKKSGEQFGVQTLNLDWDDNPKWRYTREVPYALTSPTAIAELGIAFRVATTVSSVDSSRPGAAEQPLRVGDVIKRFRFWQINKEGEEEEGSWHNLTDEPWPLMQWPCIMWTLETSSDLKKITVQIERGDKEIVLQAREDKTWPLADRGMIFLWDKRLQHADTMGEALVMGLRDTKSKIVQIYQNLQGMITGRISYKGLGGPVTIATYAYSFAGENFWEFVFFLGLIGINLAVVNFLPIPVLDGGHMVFLIYEKIRGKPASEAVRTGATIVGLLFIVSLFVFVTFLDLSRIFGK